MSVEIKIPAVGESITEVILSSWAKEDGEFVELDDVICELESDKASFEVHAEASGILRHAAEDGDTLAIGDVVARIEEQEGGSKAADNNKAEEAKSDASEASSDSKAGGETLEIVVPVVGESISEVVLANWFVEDGASVEIDENICELESDKATFEVAAEAAGVVHHAAAEGDTLAIGALIAKITTGSGGASTKKATSEAKSSTAEPSPQTSDKETYASGHASPAAAKILAEKGIAADAVKGSGRDGRITKEDALAAEKTAATPKAPQKQAPKEQVEADTSADERGQRKVRMTPLRKTIAKRLVAAKNETAMLTTFNEVDMSALMALRKSYKDLFKEKHEIGLGFMSFFTTACTIALQEFPEINAQIDGDEIVYNDFVDVSIAVSSPRGLVVPVIRNTETLGFADIEKEVVRLAVKARDGKLSIPEMTGGTFTITNGGIFGSMLSTPIINAPQSAILGMHNIVERPVAINGEVKIRPIMYLALSYDHRIVDGKQSVSFLVRVKQLIEDPARMLLGV
ncbi:MAG: 2-oxoglutarate dehydrogenase complex dihydrolipoyllysine-residue succinyltransferase [Bernardetiaceae bacterium]|nr:2-oxoglutarate dehydrogenase complex dihydrolipoyllysine-residue succinyltransferase [Bernardetiaceae bacterium]